MGIIVPRYFPKLFKKNRSKSFEAGRLKSLVKVQAIILKLAHLNTYFRLLSDKLSDVNSVAPPFFDVR